MRDAGSCRCCIPCPWACRVGRMTVPFELGIFARDYSPGCEPTLAGAPRLAPMCQSRCARRPPSDIRKGIARCTPGRNCGTRTRGRVLVIAGRCIDERWVLDAHQSQSSWTIAHTSISNPGFVERGRISRPLSVPNVSRSLLHGLCPGKRSTSLLKTSQSSSRSVFPRL